MKPYAGSDFEQYRGLEKKELEKRAATGLLRRLGFAKFEVTTDQEKPDTLVDFSDADGSLRVGCEIRSLQADEGESGSLLREFHSRWIKVMEQALAALRSDDVPAPYCSVTFRDHSYSCLQGINDQRMVSELITAGRRLRGASSLVFPQAELATLNSILREIRVVHSDGQGALWWPAHLKSGAVPALDDAIVAAVHTKSTAAKSYNWKGASEKWLLLVAEARGLMDVVGGAQQIDLPPDLTLPFTWILVWDRFSEDIWTIFPKHAVICEGREELRRPQLLPQKLRRFCTGGERYPMKPKRR